MSISYFEKNTLVKNFLNEKALTMLRILKTYKIIFSNIFLKELHESNIQIKKSQFYRYIDSLEKNNLIKVNSWVKKSSKIGCSYEITLQGIRVFDFLSLHFKK